MNTLNSGEYFGFNVDAGLATIVDTETRDLYCSFVDQWEKKILKAISTIISSHRNLRTAMKGTWNSKEQMATGSISKSRVLILVFL
jgi:hypothetical protein